MKTLRILIPGAFGLLLSVSMTSCSTSGSSAQPAAAAASASATAASSVPAPAPAVTAAGATPVSLVNVYNVVGIVPDDTQFSDSLDGDGYDCSSNLIHNSFTWKGVPFELGTANKGGNVVSCSGQSVPLPAGKYSKLELLAIGVNGAQESQVFTVNYDPASMVHLASNFGKMNESLTQTNIQSLSDWNQPDGNTGESQAIDMDYRNQSDGTRDDQPYYIYGYAFNLAPAYTVTNLVLPANSNVKVFAITLVP